MFHDFWVVFLQYLLPKRTLTRIAGYMAGIQFPPIKNWLIHTFIKKYHVDMNEALVERPEQYPDFNAFFIRKLKPDCRAIDEQIISPVDGYVSEIGCIKFDKLIQAKGKEYTLSNLLQMNNEACALFNDGFFATLYLSPKDYHRVHLPIDATLTELTYVPGKLFSVQPATTRRIPRLFANNERLIFKFQTAIGPMILIMVGATIVGKMERVGIMRFAEIKQELFLT